MKKSWRKRILSGITSAALAVSGILPSGIPLANVLKADAAEPLPNLSEDSQRDDVVLLVGSGSPLAATTVEETLANAEAEYALGIASQFCVFLQDNFIVSESDAEGRLAVGGSIDFTVNNNDWQYNIGKGDFNTQKTLNSLTGVTNYAHVIWGAKGNDYDDGKYTSPVLHNIATHVSYKETGGEDFVTPYQIFAVESDEGVAYVNADPLYASAKKQFYNATGEHKLIDFDKYFSTDSGKGML
ncbi:MAG: hypothetical protein IKQ90_08465, partial [Ruminococcus sp.]|nr:hypothetical protein [Ruminococcus sp.]